MVRAFVAIGGLLVVALLCALIAPFFVDWSAYRSDFEREASRILGRPVIVRGDASARILPFPSVTFTNVEVEGEDGKPLMTIQRFRMDAELAPYLSGELRIYSMKLEEPRAYIPLSKDGEVAWIAPKRDFLSGTTVVLENVEVSGGSVVFENRVSGRTHDLTGIEATFSARSLKGPFTGVGTLSADGEPLDFTLSTGAVTADAPGLSMKVTVNSDRVDAGLVFEGTATGDGALPRLAGSLRFQTPAPAEAPTLGSEPFAAADGSKAKEEKAKLTQPPAPVRMTSTMNATPDAIDLTDMRVTVGGADSPYTLTGGGQLDLAKLAHFTLDLSGEQIDVDKLAKGKAEKPRELTFADRMEAARRVVLAVPRPSFPGTVNIKLPVVVVGDTTIRDVAFSTSPTDEGWSLQHFQAELPGRTRIEGSGLLNLDNSLRFKGDLLVASRQPSGFSDWLTGSVDPAVRGLDRAGFSANVELSQSVQRLDNLELNIGGDTLTGRLERSGRPSDRLIAATLKGGRLDLDALLALSQIFTGKATDVVQANRIKLNLKAGPVLFRDASARSVDTDLSYDGRVLNIGRLDVRDLAGASLKAEGHLAGLSGDPSGKLSLSLAAEKPATLIDFLKARLPSSPTLAALEKRKETLGPLAISGDIETLPGEPGNKPTLEVRLGGTAAGSRMKLSLALENGFYAAARSGRFGLDLGLANDDPATLLNQIGLDTLPVGAPAPLSADVSLSGAASGPVVASATLRAPGTELSANGTLDISASGIGGADLSLLAASDDIAPWLLITGTSVGQALDTSVPVKAAGELSWSKGDWALKSVSGTIAGSRIAADLRHAAGGPVTGSAGLSALSAPWLATLVYGRPPASGPRGGWPNEAFLSPLLPPGDFQLAVKADTLELGPKEAVKNFSAHLTRSGTELQATEIDGGVAGGHVTGSAAMRNANGIGGFSIDADFRRLDLAQLLGPTSKGAGAAAEPQGASGRLNLQLSLDGSGQSYAGLVSALTGAGTADVVGASVPGIPTRALKPILSAADAEGFKPSTAAAAAIVDGLGRAARYPVGKASSDFSVAGGVARFAPVTVQHAGERLTASGSIDLSDLTVKGDVRLDLDPGDERVEGADPVILYSLSGPLASPRLSADAQPLASFLSVRALEREQARVEAMQEALQEKLRLRREVRLYRWREDRRQAAEAQRLADEAEAARLKVEAERAAEAKAAAEKAAAEKAAAEKAAAEKAAAEKAAEEQAAREAEKARQAAEARQAEKAADDAAAAARKEQAAKPQAPLVPPGGLDFDAPVKPKQDAAGAAYPSLPGVTPPTKF